MIIWIICTILWGISAGTCIISNTIDCTHPISKISFISMWVFQILQVIALAFI